MNFFIAVLFFCADDKCYFWKHKELFYTEKECMKQLVVASKTYENAGIKNEGTCLKISTKNEL